MWFGAFILVYFNCVQKPTNNPTIVLQSTNLPETVGPQDPVTSGVGSIAGINGTVSLPSLHL